MKQVEIISQDGTRKTISVKSIGVWLDRDGNEINTVEYRGHCYTYRRSKDAFCY